MTARSAARLAWSLWALAMALEAAAIPLWLANHPVLVSRFGTTEDFDPHVFLVPAYTTVGAVIAAHRRNRIGWLFLGFGLVGALLAFLSPYFIRGAIVTPGSLPAPRVAAWIGTMLWPSSYLFLCLLLLLFPDGRLPSPRWRPVALAPVVSWTVIILNSGFEPATTTIQGIAFPNLVQIQALGHPASKVVREVAVVIGVAPLALPRWRRCCAFAAPTWCSASS